MLNTVPQFTYLNHLRITQEFQSKLLDVGPKLQRLSQFSQSNPSSFYVDYENENNNVKHTGIVLVKLYILQKLTE